MDPTLRRNLKQGTTTRCAVRLSGPLSTTTYDLDAVLTHATASDRNTFHSTPLFIMRSHIEGAGFQYDQAPVDLADFRRMTALLFTKGYVARQAESFEWMETNLSLDA